MNAEATIEAYYDALRVGEPLYPFFATDESVVKFGISERLVGEEVAAGLREQTRRTHDWRVESHDLRVTEHGEVAWFSDVVRMTWRDESGNRHDHETRWSGSLSRHDGTEPAWRFVGMHVSVSREA